MKNVSQPVREAILQTLETIVDPASGKGLVTAKRVLGLEIDVGRVRLVLEAPSAEAERYGSVREAVERALRGQKGVSEAQVVLTAETSAAPRPNRTPGRAPEGIAGVRHVIAVASAKGGVGKSTVAVNLAAALAARGLASGLLDLDVFGPSVPTLLGLAGAKPRMRPGGRLEPLEAYGLKAMSIGVLVDPDAPMIWRGPMATSAVRQMLDDVDWAPLDVLVLDLPPGTGDVQLTLVQRLPLSGAVIVSTPQELALADVRRGIAMFERAAVPLLGIVENMSWMDLPDGSRAHPFGEGGARRTAEALGARFLAALPLDPALRESADEGRPLVAVAPDHPMARRFFDLAEAALEGIDAAAKPPPAILFSDD